MKVHSNRSEIRSEFVSLTYDSMEAVQDWCACSLVPRTQAPFILLDVTSILYFTSCPKWLLQF